MIKIEHVNNDENPETIENELLLNLPGVSTDSQKHENFLKPNPPTSKSRRVPHVVKIQTLKSLFENGNEENIDPNMLPIVPKNKYDKWPFYLCYSMINPKYFDDNLLLRGKNKDGCECTHSQGIDFINPFYITVDKKVICGKEQFSQCGHINQEDAVKQHCIKFCFNGLFNSLVTRSKPTIYVSECVHGTKDSIGCTYSLVVKLVKNKIICQMHTVERFFEKSAYDQLKLSIRNYPDFDELWYCHRLESPTLSCKNVYSIKVGRSCVKFVSSSIKPPDNFQDK